MERPTQTEWEAAVADGFTSNGATMSPDVIYGIPIAYSDTRYPGLPANLHDYRYWCGGTEEDRRRADAEFLRGLYACVDHFTGLRRKAARRRCRSYYVAVRDLGGLFWRLRDALLTFGG